MEIRIVAVGKLKEEYLRRASADYASRLGRYCRLSQVELPEEDIASRPEKEVKAVEAGRLLSKVPAGHRVVVLDRLGKEPSSEELASWLDREMTRGASRFAFIIGGALGLGDEVLDRADYTLSLSKLTFTHQIARVLLLEQLYRSFKIIRNEPYHY